MSHGTQGHSVQTSKTSFQRTADTCAAKPLSDHDLQVLCEKLREQYYIYLADGLLHIPLSPDYTSGAVRIAREVGSNPALKDKVVFSESGFEPRAYDDVVWNLQDRGLDLARVLYKEQSRDEISPIRVIVTTPVIGLDRGTVHCRTIEALDKNRHHVRMGVQMDGLNNFTPGNSYIAQTNNCEVTGADENFDTRHRLDLKIRAAPACIQSWSQTAGMVPHHNVL